MRGSSSEGKGGTTGTGGQRDPGTGGTGPGTNGTGGTGVQSTDFSFSLSPSALMLPLGGTQTVTVTIDRDLGTTTFTDPLTFELDLPSSITGTGVAAVFTPAKRRPRARPRSHRHRDTGIAAGNYTLNVVATAGTGATAMQYTVALPLKVTSAAATTLLVDNDFSDNNANNDTTDHAFALGLDTLFATLLRTRGSRSTRSSDRRPSGRQHAGDHHRLTGYSTIVWYTGDSTAPESGPSRPRKRPSSRAGSSWGQDVARLLQNLAYDLAARLGRPRRTVPGQRCRRDRRRRQRGSRPRDYSGEWPTGTPFAGQPSTSSRDSMIPSTADTINPAAGTDALVTVVENPDGQLGAAATAVRRRWAGSTSARPGRRPWSTSGSQSRTSS